MSHINVETVNGDRSSATSSITATTETNKSLVELSESDIDINRLFAPPKYLELIVNFRKLQKSETVELPVDYEELLRPDMRQDEFERQLLIGKVNTIFEGFLDNVRYVGFFAYALGNFPGKMEKFVTALEVWKNRKLNKRAKSRQTIDSAPSEANKIWTFFKECKVMHERSKVVNNNFINPTFLKLIHCTKKFYREFEAHLSRPLVDDIERSTLLRENWKRLKKLRVQFKSMEAKLQEDDVVYRENIKKKEGEIEEVKHKILHTKRLARARIEKYVLASERQVITYNDCFDFDELEKCVREAESNLQEEIKANLQEEKMLRTRVNKLEMQLAGLIEKYDRDALANAEIRCEIEHEYEKQAIINTEYKCLLAEQQIEYTKLSLFAESERKISESINYSEEESVSIEPVKKKRGKHNKRPRK